MQKPRNKARFWFYSRFFSARFFGFATLRRDKQITARRFSRLFLSFFSVGTPAIPRVSVRAFGVGCFVAALASVFLFRSVRLSPVLVGGVSSPSAAIPPANFAFSSLSAPFDRRYYGNGNRRRGKCEQRIRRGGIDVGKRSHELSRALVGGESHADHRGKRHGGYSPSGTQHHPLHGAVRRHAHSRARSRSAVVYHGVARPRFLPVATAERENGAPLHRIGHAFVTDIAVAVAAEGGIAANNRRHSEQPARIRTARRARRLPLSYQAPAVTVAVILTESA